MLWSVRSYFGLLLRSSVKKPPTCFVARGMLKRMTKMWRIKGRKSVKEENSTVKSYKTKGLGTSDDHCGMDGGALGFLPPKMPPNIIYPISLESKKQHSSLYLYPLFSQALILLTIISAEYFPNVNTKWIFTMNVSSILIVNGTVVLASLSIVNVCVICSFTHYYQLTLSNLQKTVSYYILIYKIIINLTNSSNKNISNFHLIYLTLSLHCISFV